MKFTSRTYVLAALLVATCTWAIGYTVSRPTIIVTFDEARQIWDGASGEGTGYTYGEVVSVIGSEGLPNSSIDNQQNPEGSLSYRWDNPPGHGWLIADFENDHLISVRIDPNLVEN